MRIYRAYTHLFVFQVTLPTPLTFPLGSSIPYYIVFTTTPRSRVLAAEIMADAWAPRVTTYVYRYNTANPLDASGLVEHAAESWMMFKGTHDG